MSQYKNIRGYLMKFHILAEQQILSTCGYLGCLADKCDEVGAHSCTNIGVNWRTFSRSSFTTCASSSTQAWAANGLDRRSEEHTSELQSLMRIPYAVFCLNKKNIYTYYHTHS